LTDTAVFRALEATVARHGFRLVTLDTTPSTNDEVRQRVGEDDGRPLWVVAAEQTKGRGRHGRVWSSPRGNLYASLILPEPCAPADAPQLGFVAGLALHDAVAAVTGLAAPRLALKWPNDLIVDGAKVAGILLEGHRIGAARRFAVIVGIGVNVAAAPSDTPYRATHLACLAGEVDLAKLFENLSAHMAKRLGAWQRGSDFAVIRAAWLSRAAGLGAPVTVRLPGREARGIFQGMDSRGRLVLDGDRSREAIDAGDLFFGLSRTEPLAATRHGEE
jgi:BirA family biotin operon repressor/biotin-[acetyl-CoA-carboxylase] ligase